VVPQLRPGSYLNDSVAGMLGIVACFAEPAISDYHALVRLLTSKNVITTNRNNSASIEAHV
jgi:hypothetical protein